MNFSLGGYNFSVNSGAFVPDMTEEKNENGIKIFKFTLSSDTPEAPENIRIAFRFDSAGVYSTWSPSHNFKRDVSFAEKTLSGCATGAPVYAAIDKKGNNKLTVALSDALNLLSISESVIEETAEIGAVIYLFTGLSSPVKKYETLIYIDERSVPYYQSLKNVGEWWREIRYPSAYIPEGAKMPLYSAWYSFHQNVDTDSLVSEAEKAAALGLENFILDDGWQTDDNSRGYAYTGDWKVAAKKIPDMKSLCDKIHKCGLKFMIWYSVPYVGIHSENYEKFKGKYLNNAEGKDFFTLDPRFPEVRKFLVNLYSSAVKDWGLDGLKLDFIDSFKLYPSSSTDYENMDFISVEEAAQRLLFEIKTALTEINKDILIEFRQKYIGPVMQEYGNMLRVSDCPSGALNNRVGSTDIRLIAGKTPVHSDMVMWSKSSSAEEAAHQLANIFFTVPQISVRIESLSDEHRRMLEFYLSLWKKKKDTLLDGEFMPFCPEAGYSKIEAKKDKDAVFGLYSDTFVNIDGLNTALIINATGNEFVTVHSTLLMHAVVKDALGNKLLSVQLSSGINELNVPECGVIEITRSAWE